MIVCPKKLLPHTVTPCEIAVCRSTINAGSGLLAGAPPDTCAVVISTETESGFITEDDTSPVCHTPSCPSTKRNLHSHKEMAPITKNHQQITCYGQNGVGDVNDVWRVEIIGEDKRIPISTITSKIQLIHHLTGCALYSSSKQLPDWGMSRWKKFFGISCSYVPGKFWFKAKKGEITSKPWQWPINIRGQLFSAQKLRIYLLGNPVIWWTNLVLLQIFLILKFIFAVQNQRNLYLMSNFKGLDSSRGITTWAYAQDRKLCYLL
ncbi:protein O-mannosyl-transferase 2 [Trichonephila clavipes]|nr:protein O-mannosyl-transferase 2 [Trichonephila clavipes]